MSGSEVAYRCDAESFTGVRRHAVRWLDPVVDDALFVQFCRRRGEKASSGDLSKRAAEGFTYASVIESGFVVARAARWTCAAEAWELAAVATLDQRQREGLGRSVCSFVTAAILEAGRIATCHTDSTNLPMRRLAESIGFSVVFHASADDP